MRIPFPERVSYNHALTFASVICAVQIFEGTNRSFAGLCFCFVLVATAAFNIAGGMPFPVGAFIGFNAIFTVLIPITAKALLLEPADSHLRAPVRTMEVYLCGMIAMLAAALVTRYFRPSKAYLSDMLPASGLRAAYLGSGALAYSLGFVRAAVSHGNGSIGSILDQTVDRIAALSILLGVMYTIRRTNGRRSVSWPLLCMILYSSLMGLYGFSKETILTPFLCWAVVVALMRYRLHWINIVVLIGGGYVAATYLMPYAQVGRDIDPEGRSPREVSAYVLSHMSEVRQTYAEAVQGDRVIRFYPRPMGLLDRLELFSVDDAIIDLTDRQGVFGYEPIIESFENGIPHVLWANKPVPAFGNVYAHEIGVIGVDDVTTGVSFSPSADAYREGGMTGVLVVESAVLILVFLVLDRVVGDVRRNPAGLLITVLVTRSATEGMLGGVPNLIEQPLYITVAAAFVCAYMLPVLGTVFGKSLFAPAPMQPVSSS